MCITTPKLQLLLNHFYTLFISILRKQHIYYSKFDNFKIFVTVLETTQSVYHNAIRLLKSKLSLKNRPVEYTVPPSHSHFC